MKIRQMRKEIMELKKAVSPLREAVMSLKKGSNPLVSKPTSRFLSDLLDHINHVNDAVEAFRENINGLTDLYHSFQSSRLNEVMKVLTVISTIFIPLSFLAGLYGMNFRNMPELDYKYGYFILLAIMFIMVSGMLYYFKKKKWI
jgi:magnesium transporter